MDKEQELEMLINRMACHQVEIRRLHHHPVDRVEMLDFHRVTTRVQKLQNHPVTSLAAMSLVEFLSLSWARIRTKEIVDHQVKLKVVEQCQVQVKINLREVPKELKLKAMKRLVKRVKLVMSQNHREQEGQRPEGTKQPQRITVIKNPKQEKKVAAEISDQLEDQKDTKVITVFMLKDHQIIEEEQQLSLKILISQEQLRESRHARNS
jgi:hypothetical protein